MEVQIAAYAKGYVITKAKRLIREDGEFRAALARLEEAQKEYDMLIIGFEAQAQALRSQAADAADYQNKIRELQRKVSEVLSPKGLALRKMEEEVKQLERRLFVRHLREQVQDEVEKLRLVLAAFRPEEAREGAGHPWGRLGLGSVLGCRLKASKEEVKEIRRRLKGIALQKIDVFVEEL